MATSSGRALRLRTLTSFAQGDVPRDGAVGGPGQFVCIAKAVGGTGGRPVRWKRARAAALLQTKRVLFCSELAHQWFGNLVTMEWWEGLWLNEGFASWVEYLCVDHCFPEWNIWTQFVYMDVGRAFELDGLASSHPVEVPVFKVRYGDPGTRAPLTGVHTRRPPTWMRSSTPSRTPRAAPSSACCRAGWVRCRLMGRCWGCSRSRSLGQEPFRQGLIAYLKKYAYANAVTEDLWAALGAASGKDVSRVMGNVR